MSSKKDRSPEEQARREKIRKLLQSSGVSSMKGIQDLFTETIVEFMERGPDAELEKELGYSKYDYKHKDTDNSRNRHSSKTLRTSFEDVEVSDSTVSRVTDKILPSAGEWQQRPLEAIYAVVFLDAIHDHVRSEGQIHEESGVCCHRHRSGRQKGRAGYVGWRERKRQVWGNRSQ